MENGNEQNTSRQDIVSILYHILLTNGLIRIKGITVSQQAFYLSMGNELEDWQRGLINTWFTASPIPMFITADEGVKFNILISYDGCTDIMVVLDNRILKVQVASLPFLSMRFRKAKAHAETLRKYLEHKVQGLGVVVE
jgi:hypothetical protein